MAEQAQNQGTQEEEPGFSLFNVKELPQFIWNWAVKLPGIKSLRIGRKRIGERKHPIERELRTSWLGLNDAMFESTLEKIETSWPNETELLGSLKTDTKFNLLSNPNGIVALYKKLGIYADKDRVPSELHWFQFGTESEEHDSPYELPDRVEWKKYGWKEVDVNKLKSNSSEPWKIYKVKKLKLNAGVVFHEGKTKEEIYTFGYLRTRELGGWLRGHLNAILEDLRRNRIGVEIRTPLAHVADEFEKLFQAIANIEQETYKYLSDITPDIKPGEGTMEKYWKKLVDDNTPEKIGILIRFAHTYRVIRRYINEKNEEKIKEIDDNGQVYEKKLKIVEDGKIIYEGPIFAFKTINFNPEENAFPNELIEVNDKIQNLGGDARTRREADECLAKAQQRITQINQLNNRIKPLMLTELKYKFKTAAIDNFETFMYKNEILDFLKKLLKDWGELILFIKKLDYKMKVDEIYDVINQTTTKFGVKNKVMEDYFQQTQRKLFQYYTVDDKRLLIRELPRRFIGILNLLNYKMKVDEIYDIINQTTTKFGIKNKVMEEYFQQTRIKLFQYHTVDDKKLLLKDVARRFIRILNSLQNNNKISKEQFYKISKDFQEKFNKLPVMADSIEDNKISKDLFNSISKDFQEKFNKLPVIANSIEEDVTPQNYDAKVDELFDFIKSNFDKFDIKTDRVTSRIFDDLKMQLKQQPYSQSEKKRLLEQLYENFVNKKTKQGIIDRSLRELKQKTTIQLKGFLDILEKNIDELVNSKDEEFEKKSIDLLDFIGLSFLKTIGVEREDKIEIMLEVIELEESKISDEQLKKIRDLGIGDDQIKKLKKFMKVTRDSFNTILNAQELSQLLSAKTSALLEKIKLIEKRKELMGLLFRKEQLEDYIKHLMPKNPRFYKRDEEWDYGIDENGYPLEIDPHTGEVLIDKWWRELLLNKWQLETIAKKPGGKFVLKTHLNLDVKIDEKPNPKDPTKKITIIELLNWTPDNPDNHRKQRYVDDKRFHGYVDLLDAACMIFGTWDSVRDDFRDGRYHPHSKTVGDYVIEGMGGFDENLGAPYLKKVIPGITSERPYLTRKGIIPEKSAAFDIKVNEPRVYIYAKPSDFDDPKKVPKDEQAITRDFKIRIPDSVTNLPKRDDIIRTPYGKFLVGTRMPTKYNPAFDRRAESLIHNYMHWGCMYYYRWPGYPQEWSENPFPHISTRGIALYIAYLVASDVWYYAEGEQALKGHKFDYGVRGQGKFGYVNPLSGEGILQEN